MHSVIYRGKAVPYIYSLQKQNIILKEYDDGVYVSNLVDPHLKISFDGGFMWYGAISFRQCFRKEFIRSENKIYYFDFYYIFLSPDSPWDSRAAVQLYLDRCNKHFFIDMLLHGKPTSRFNLNGFITASSSDDLLCLNNKACKCVSDGYNYTLCDTDKVIARRGNNL